jgi:integrase/recombinase XerD
MLQEAVDEYIASLSLREHEQAGNNQNTVVAYRNDLNQLCVYLEQQKLANWSQVTHEHITNHLLAMREEQGYRSTTIARKQAALKSFFRYLQNTGIIPTNPVEHLKTPRVQKEPPHVLSAEQISNLFLQIEVETPIGGRDFAMLHMLYATGMRVSELVSLNLADFDAERAVVICPGRNGRNKRTRELPLPPVVVEATQHYIRTTRSQLIQRHPDEQALFLNHHGERLTRQGFWLIIKGYARQAGITDITPQMLRHSFALLMLKEGKELRSVQKLLGHAHITTTQIYSQLARPKRTTSV